MSNNKQSSSVEWLFEELFNSFEKFNNGEFSFAEYMAHNLKLREQAKEMHKKEMINFTVDWYHHGLLSLGVLVSTSVEEHYNKIFKQ